MTWLLRIKRMKPPPLQPPPGRISFASRILQSTWWKEAVLTFRSAIMNSQSISKLPDVEIDESGRFKYILLRAEDFEKQSKHLVRGFAAAEYHADIFERMEQQVKSMDIKLECLGGGRIERSGDSIKVYGHSLGFGKADHEISVGVLKKTFPNHKITWSNDGY